MFLFHHKREIVTRNYDVVGGSIMPIPLKQEGSDEVKLHSDVGTIKDIAALFSSIFLSALGFGILMVMIAVKLDQYVKNEVLMSVSSATQIFAGIVFARFLPYVGRKLGLIHTIYLGTIISAICSILFYFYVNFFLWILVIFFYGMSAFICGVTRQTVMINLAPRNMRAMIISLGGMLVAIGNSLGPIFLEMIQTSNSLNTFLIASALFATSIIPLSRLRYSENKTIPEEKKITLWRYIHNSPKIMFAGFCVNYAISSSNSFLIIYGLKVGMDQNNSSLLLSVFLFGSIFSIPMAYIVDLLNRRFVMISSGVLSVICIYLLYLTQDLQRTYTLLFLMFGALTGVKLSAVVLINDKYKATQRLAVNSAFSRMSLSGNIVGIFTTGIIMNSLGAKGLWVSVMLIMLLFLLFCLANYSNKFLKKEIDWNNFSIFNTQKNEEEL